MKCAGECELCDVCGLQHRDDELDCQTFDDIVKQAGLREASGEMIRALDIAYIKGLVDGRLRATEPVKITVGGPF